MVFAALNTTSLHSYHRTMLNNLGFLMGEKGATYRYQPSQMADWMKEGFTNSGARDNLQVLDLTPEVKGLVLKAITQYVGYLREPSFEEHWKRHSEAYISATHLLLGTTGEVKVDRFYVWVDPDNPVMSPHILLAKHFNIPCINFGNPPTRIKMEDWVMYNTLEF